MQISGNAPTVAQPTPATPRRCEFLKIRLTTGERIDLDEAAERLGKSVSEFVRDAAMHQAGIVNSVVMDELNEPDRKQERSISPTALQSFQHAEVHRIREQFRPR